MESRAGVVSEASTIPLPPSSRYRVIEPLRAVQSRHVYLAEEIQSARRASLEVFDVRMNAELEARFQQEAHLAARLCRQHPGVVEVCEWGQLDDGRPYIVCDDVEGRRLSDLLQEGPLGTDRALSIAFQLAGTIETLHNAGFVHQRLRPAVVILRDADTAKLAECHLASILDTLLAGRPPSGTPPAEWTYAAPEQIAGRGATERSDLYSLALILLEMLRGSSPNRTSDGRVAPSEFRELPPAFARILARALEIDPERRQTDASAFTNDLYAARANQPSGAEEVRKAVRSRLPSRPKGAMVSLVLLLALGAATLAFTSLIGGRTERASTVVPHPERPVTGMGPREPAPADLVTTAPEQSRANTPLPVAEARPQPEAPPPPPALPGEPTQNHGGVIPDQTRSSAETRRQLRSPPTAQAPPNEPPPERASAITGQMRPAPAPPRSARASGTEGDEPDPAAIIDWLLEGQAGKRRP